MRYQDAFPSGAGLTALPLSKTTTLLFKMLLVERTHQMTGADAPKPRQIFVTQSRILAKKVEQYFVTLGRSLIASSQSLSDLCEIRASQRGNVLDDEDDMIDVDDIVDWSGDLPSKFSDLRDEHFPLFTTFNGVCIFPRLWFDHNSYYLALCHVRSRYRQC